MKKKALFFLLVIAGLVTAIKTAKSMTEAIIDAPTCMSCGACWEVGEPYSTHDDGTTYWGKYQTGEFSGLRFYSYPSGEHQNVIEEGQNRCPADCIIIW